LKATNAFQGPIGPIVTWPMRYRTWPFTSKIRPVTSMLGCMILYAGERKQLSTVVTRVPTDSSESLVRIYNWSNQQTNSRALMTQD